MGRFNFLTALTLENTFQSNHSGGKHAFLTGMTNSRLLFGLTRYCYHPVRNEVNRQAHNHPRLGF